MASVVRWILLKKTAEPCRRWLIGSASHRGGSGRHWWDNQNTPPVAHGFVEGRYHKPGTIYSALDVITSNQ